MIIESSIAEDMEKGMKALNKTIETHKEEKQAMKSQEQSKQVQEKGKEKDKHPVPDLPKEKYMRPEPKIKLNLKYKPMENITHVGNYIVNIQKCYNDALNFNWDECDYQLQFRD